MAGFSVVALVGVSVLSQTLPGSGPLEYDGDAAERMVAGIHRYLDREIVAARQMRAQAGTPDRQRFRIAIGAVDPRVAFSELKLEPRKQSAAAFEIQEARWPVFEGVDAEGLLLTPKRSIVARVVAVPDADQAPELFASGWAGRLAASGCQVLIPVLIDRQNKWSGITGVRMTKQPHREWIWRMAFETGRHIIGYEVQKVLAAVDWFEKQGGAAPLRVGVAGYGEGGLMALYAGALDTRISSTLVSGYFGARERVWQEPIYRDVWGLLREFGDAELARMIAPRTLVVEASRAPDSRDPGEVAAEVERARAFNSRLALVKNDAPGSTEGLTSFLKGLGQGELAGESKFEPLAAADAGGRMHRQFKQLVDYTQGLIRKSPQRRKEFWAGAVASPEEWQKSARPLRDAIWNDVIGRLPDPSLPVNARTRLLFDRERYTGYEVMLDVWPDVFAQGILLVPKGIREGERRPVVVCQHGLEGRPRDVADPAIDSPYYHQFAVRLAEEGFVTFAPQNPYIGRDHFRSIQRKAHPLRLSLFSFILGQHQRILEWLGSLPFADARRIGFYGLSYGGKTAVRVPPLLDGYALSICSADFNEWVWKTTSIEAPFSYMVTEEYDMYEFDFASKVNYSDLAKLMAPRPFMVERGHDDGVSIDEWVAYEYAPVRRFYDKMGIADRTAIEFFDGPHTIHGKGTFEFLRRFLGPIR